VSLLLHHVRGQNRLFWRSPVGAFFTIALPLIMLVLFVALFGNDVTETIESGTVTTAQFYAPGLAAFSAASATYTNLGINLSIRRDDGILKRVRSTPLPPATYLGAVVLSAVWIALVAVVLMLGVGMVFYGVELDPAKLPAMVLSFVIGSATFAVLGVALSGVVGSSASAPALANATILPLAFISSVFISFDDDAPKWLLTLGDVFPLKPFAVSFQEAMSPFTDPPAILWDRLAVMLAWCVVGSLVAWRRFRWEPTVGRDTSARSSRRRRR
jgi:ABC-2 type transport system permease protein